MRRPALTFWHWAIKDYFFGISLDQTGTPVWLISVGFILTVAQ